MAEPTVRVADSLLERIRHSAELSGRTVDEEVVHAFERHPRSTLPGQDHVVAMIRETRDAMSYVALPRENQ